MVDSVHRHCDSCAKNVVDFSQMSDDEVLLFFRNSTGNICGRFRKEQMNRPYTPIPGTTRSAQWWKAAALLPLTLFGKNLSAQTDSVSPPDSLQVMNDTLTPLPEIVNDSAVVAVDSAVVSQDTSITILIGDSAIAAKPECAPVDVTISGGATITPIDDRMGVVFNPPVTSLGNVYHSLPPRLDFVPFVTWFERLRNPKADDKLETTNPDFVISAEEHQPKPDPVPPTIPERPWYEAILPERLRSRRS